MLTDDGGEMKLNTVIKKLELKLILNEQRTIRQQLLHTWLCQCENWKNVLLEIFEQEGADRVKKSNKVKGQVGNK